ncbi:MAG: dephospho-CoA kinase [Gemmatimonadaceae bacterium]|nr:dephospho-CoA kinase [Gemmatimonadaceae bacterium]
MLLVALTGNIASGKSLVSALLRERGAAIVDADVLAREAVAPGTAAIQAIRARWGPGVIGADGALDRAALRAIVFSDPVEREALNAIVHPEIERRRNLAVEAARIRGVAIVVCDIPLLFEIGQQDRFDVVILVDAPEDLRFARLTARRQLGDEEARAMMNAQIPAAAKRARATIVVDNDGSLAQLETRVDAVWQELVRRAAAQ